MRILTVTANPAVDLTLSVSSVRLGSVHRVHQSRSNAGGKGINVASLLADAGFELTVTGWLGEDNRGIFDKWLARKAIANKLILLPGETRTNVKLVDIDGGTTTDFNGAGLTPSDADVATLSARVQELAEEHEWVVLSGSLPPGVSSTIYEDLIRVSIQAGAQVALDTSGDPLRFGLQARPDLVKPNRSELSALLGRPLDDLDEVRNGAATLREGGIPEVVVSLGSQGALFLTRDGDLLARPPSVRVASTVGAGDALVAGLVAGHAQGLSLVDRARLATAFAAHAVSIVGNDLPAPKELEALADRVSTHRL